MPEQQAMKAITVWQPWASLLACGAKRIETRHWSPPPAIVGQRIAIHAAARRRELDLVDVEPFRSALAAVQRTDDGHLPTGAIVATAVLAKAEQMTPDYCLSLARNEPHEFAFGHHEPGRYAWHFTDALPTAEPIAWRGAQGFWTLPPEVVPALHYRRRWITDPGASA